MSSDSGSQLMELWDAVVSGILDVYSAWGWVPPAILLTLLFCAAVILLSWLLEDVPLEDVELLRVPLIIFRWTRKHWRQTHWSNGKGTPDLVCLSLKADS